MITSTTQIPLIPLVILTFCGAFVWFVIAERLWQIIGARHRNYFMRWAYLFSGASLYTGWCMIMIPLLKLIMEKF